jgi:hypothetical protein
MNKRTFSEFTKQLNNFVDNYYLTELNKIDPSQTIYAPTVKIFANGNGTDTKHITLNKESAETLIYWLKKNFIDN